MLFQWEASGAATRTPLMLSSPAWKQRQDKLAAAGLAGRTKSRRNTVVIGIPASGGTCGGVG